MKAKQLIIGLIVVVCGGIGYAMLKSHRAAAASDEAAAPPTVVTVQTGTIQRLTLHRYVTGYGTVAPAPAIPGHPAADAPLAAPAAGVVAKVNVVAGQHVRKGEVLMELNSSAVTAKYARAEVRRQKKLYAQHNTSLKALQNAEDQLAALQVVAPLSGTVTRLNVKPGAAVNLNMVVAEVMDLKRLVVQTEVPESKANELKVGQPVQVLTQPTVSGTLTFVSPAVNASNGTVWAWATLPADSGLRPGQFVPLRIVTAVHKDCLAVPLKSVVTDIAGNSVISLVQGDEAVRAPVKTGFQENDWVEVTGNGLKAGDTVVTVGAYGLPPKTQIQVVNPSGDESSATSSSSSQAQ